MFRKLTKRLKRKWKCPKFRKNCYIILSVVGTFVALVLLKSAIESSAQAASVNDYTVEPIPSTISVAENNVVKEDVQFGEQTNPADGKVVESQPEETYYKSFFGLIKVRETPKMQSKELNFRSMNGRNDNEDYRPDDFIKSLKPFKSGVDSKLKPIIPTHAKNVVKSEVSEQVPNSNIYLDMNNQSNALSNLPEYKEISKAVTSGAVPEVSNLSSLTSTVKNENLETIVEVKDPSMIESNIVASVPICVNKITNETPMNENNIVRKISATDNSITDGISSVEKNATNGIHNAENISTNRNSSTENNNIKPPSISESDIVHSTPIKIKGNANSKLLLGKSEIVKPVEAIRRSASSVQSLPSAKKSIEQKKIQDNKNLVTVFHEGRRCYTYKDKKRTSVCNEIKRFGKGVKHVLSDVHSIIENF